MFGFPGDIQVQKSSGSERRASDRFPIEREVRFKVVSKRYGHEGGQGKTLNMSSSGVLFTCDSTLLPGKKVEMAISWPAQLDNKTGLKLMARGRVVRVEQNCAAVEIHQYEFRTLGNTGLAL